MIVAVAAIGLIVTTALAAPGRLVTGEEVIFTEVNGLPRWVGLPLEGIMQLGGFVASLAVAAVAALRGRSRVALAAGGGWALVRITSSIMKATVGRDRPPAFFADVALRQHLPADNGFPSSHAANAAALAVVVAWALPRARLPVVLVAVLVGVARLYVGVHLPLDLVGGWCLGVLCGLTAIALVTRLTGRNVSEHVR
ncbi:MAG TPA: phosphatase PAP2 family protein [Iamia sp.]|nr:phosphatase PAP2 family protein [Iamia sp.]